MRIPCLYFCSFEKLSTFLNSAHITSIQLEYISTSMYRISHTVTPTLTKRPQNCSTNSSITILCYFLTRYIYSKLMHLTSNLKFITRLITIYSPFNLNIQHHQIRCFFRSFYRFYKLHHAIKKNRLY